MLLISLLDNSLGLRLCAMAEPNGLADRKLEFRTMLKRVADQFRPEDVESLAFIHHLPATEPRTALGALSWMERKVKSSEYSDLPWHVVTGPVPEAQYM